MFSNEVQYEKDEPPMLFTFAGITIFSNEKHRENVELLMISIFDGITIDFKNLQ